MVLGKIEVSEKLAVAGSQKYPSIHAQLVLAVLFLRDVHCEFDYWLLAASMPPIKVYLQFIELLYL